MLFNPSQQMYQYKNQDANYQRSRVHLTPSNIPSKSIKPTQQPIIMSKENRNTQTPNKLINKSINKEQSTNLTQFSNSKQNISKPTTQQNQYTNNNPYPVQIHHLKLNQMEENYQSKQQVQQRQKSYEITPQRNVPKMVDRSRDYSNMRETEYNNNKKLKEDNQKLQEQNKYLNEQLQLLTSDIECIQNKLIELTNLNDRFHQINNQQSIKIKQLETQLSQYQSNQNQHEKLMTQLKQDKLSLQSQIKDLNNFRNDLLQMNQNLQGDLKNQEQQNQVLEEEITYLKKRLTGNTNEVAQQCLKIIQQVHIKQIDQLKIDYIRQLLNSNQENTKINENQDIVEQCMSQQSEQLKRQIQTLTLENQLLYMSLHQKAT